MSEENVRITPKQETIQSLEAIRNTQAAEIKRLEAELNDAIAELNRYQKAVVRLLPMEAQLAEAHAALDDAKITLSHARVFIGSREKMHPDGRSLYDECVANIEKALTTDGKAAADVLAAAGLVIPFAQDLIQEWASNDWMDIDGGDLQSLAIKHGVVVERPLRKEEETEEWAQEYDMKEGDPTNDMTPLNQAFAAWDAYRKEGQGDG